MPSKYNEKMLRVDRMNRMEKTKLDFMIRRYDKEKISMVHEIDREKRAVVKDFAHVRRTSGFSEEGIPSHNEKEDTLKTDSVFGSRFSKSRINSAKSLRSSSARSMIYSDINGNFKSPRNTSNSSESEDEVFITEETKTFSLPDFTNMAATERFEKELIESYKNVFKNTEITVKKSDKKNLARFLRSRSEGNKRKLVRPQTAKCHNMSFETSISLPVRPSTASLSNGHAKMSNESVYLNGSTRNVTEKLFTKPSTSDNNVASPCGNSLHTVAEDPEHENSISPSVKQLIDQILEEESNNANTQTIPQLEQTFHSMNGKTKPETGILRTRKNSTSTNQTSDVDTDNNSKILRQFSATGSRQRKVSINSTSMASDIDRLSNIWGSIGDISLDSNGQRKPSNWRKYVAADSAPIPETKRLVNLTTVVKAALAFSKTARKRALERLVEEQSVDTRQLVQQERLRRLQSRSDILMSLSSQWSVEKNGDMNGPFTLMEED